MLLIDAFESRIEFFTKQAPNAVCVEVGTRYGDLAIEAVTARPDLNLTVVDSWHGAFADGEVITRAKLDGRAEIIKMDSVKAATFFKDNSLDMVYIDAAHDYLSVTQDIHAWWPKIKVGGVLAGHDYENKPDDGFWGPIEVKQAVDDWSNGVAVNSIEPSCPSWWVEKCK